MSLSSDIIYPSVIYKRFRDKDESLDKMNELNILQWFALNDNYGSESYGNILKSYKFKREPKLLNIGDANIRLAIENEIMNIYPNKDKYVLDPNTQYSGGASNKIYHDIVKNIFGNEYDGTIIDETQLKGNNKYKIEDLEGPTEIVIWKDFTNLLEEKTNKKIENKESTKYTINK
jgi:hypothetical protein